jgi:hypothetical protein
MRDEINYLHPVQPFGLKEVNGVGITLRKNSRQNVSGINFLFPTALYMGNGPLQDPIKGHGLRGLPSLQTPDRLQGGAEKILQFLLQAGSTATTTPYNLNGKFIVEEAKENMLDGNMFMVPGFGFPNGQHQGNF